MTGSTVFYEHTAFMNSCVNFEVVLQHFIISAALHCCFDWQKKRTSCGITEHSPSDHDTNGMFYRSLCTTVIKSYHNRPINCPFSFFKLLDCGLIREKHFNSPCFIPVFTLLGKDEPLNFHGLG